MEQVRDDELGEPCRTWDVYEACVRAQNNYIQIWLKLSMLNLLQYNHSSPLYGDTQLSLNKSFLKTYPAGTVCKKQVKSQEGKKKNSKQ